jgi:protein-L-isoaspartate(D-aspartate) O-methyltransferase
MESLVMSHPISQILKRARGFLLLASAIGMSTFDTVAFVQARDSYAAARLKMVEENLVREGIKNEGVLKAMRSVPRHLFCPPDERAAAYYDQALPIGHKQTISSPFIVAYMTELLDPQPDDSVLEIGTGSGYQAAVLSALVKDVYTIEIVEALGKKAADLLKEQRFDNVHPRVGDGYKGWPEHAPFDKIIVTCSPENVPQPLTDQLKEGGKIIIPLGERYEQMFYLIEKKEGQLTTKKLIPTYFVPMTGISEDKRQVQADPSWSMLRNGGFEEEEEGHPKGWYYQRQLTRETKGAPEGEAFAEFTNRDAGRGAMALQAFEVDGGKVASLQISVRVKGQDLKFGPTPLDKPALVVQFYDADRKPKDMAIVGPWKGTFDWKRASKLIHVPAEARGAVLRVGLNGGTGVLGVDDVQMKSVKR